jgi:formate hydrogenlyase subunit 4
MNEWLEQRPVWQFALIWGGCLFVALLAGGLISQQFFKHHVDMTFVVTYAVVFAVVSATMAALTRRLRRPGGRSSDPAGRTR